MKAYQPITAISFCLLMACAPLKKPDEMAVNKPYPPAPPSETETIDHAPASHASNLTSWDISGAIAARNKRKSWTASLNWLQQGAESYQIRLMGPLGGGTVMIEKHNGIITFRDGPKTISSKDADKLLFTQTGVRLPVSHLYYWVRGIPAPGKTGEERAVGHQQVSQFNQDGYNVMYSQYMKVQDLILPSKIKLEGHGVLIKLVIKRWKV